MACKPEKVLSNIVKKGKIIPGHSVEVCAEYLSDRFPGSAETYVKVIKAAMQKKEVRMSTSGLRATSLVVVLRPGERVAA